MNTVVVFGCDVQIEVSEYTLRKSSFLIQCIQTGRIGKKRVRPAMSAADIAEKTNVSRSTVYAWRRGTSMPQPEAFKLIIENLLGVTEADLKQYLYGHISIQALLSIKTAQISSVVLINNYTPLETSKDTLHRLSLLFECIQTGRLSKKIIRPPMMVDDIAHSIGISCKTFYEWRNGASMPQPGNLRSIAKNLLKVTEKDLADYLTGAISLKELLSIKPKASTPDEVYNIFHTLEERDKDAVLALLLRDRALEVGNFSLQKNSKRSYAVSSTTNVLDGEDRLMASSIGEGLFPHMAKRLRSLLIASQEKHSRIVNEQLDLDEIAERHGVHPGTYSILAVEAAAEGTIGETYGHRLFAPEWNAMAAICFEPTGWRGDQLVGLTNRTFKDRAETLKRSLSENGNPNRV